MIRYPMFFMALMMAGPFACSPAWQPARPADVTLLHARIDKLELAIQGTDGTRRERMQKTREQSEELEEITRERFIFSNAVARVWTRLYQDLEGMKKTADDVEQGLDYMEKRLALDTFNLEKAISLFHKEYDSARGKLLEDLCGPNPTAAICRGWIAPEVTPQGRNP